MARPVVKKDDIEEAAIRLLATKGLAATTIRDIAAAAGVAEGALYRHYSGKDDLAWRLYCREVAAFTIALEPMLRAGPQPLARRLLAAVTFIYGYYRVHPDRLVFALLTRHSFPQQHILDARVNPDQAVIRFLKREMAAGNIPPAEPTLMMAIVRGVVLQPVLMHRYGRLRKHPLALAGEVTAACMRALNA